MRTAMSISVPEALRAEIEREVRDGRYASVSEFFRTVMRERQEYVILRDVEESRREIRSRRGHTLRSLKNLR